MWENCVQSVHTFSRASSHTVIKNLFLLSRLFFYHCSAFCAMSFQFGVVLCLSHYGLTVLCICLVLACFMFLSGFGLIVCCFSEIMDQLYCFCLVMIDCLLFLSGFGSTFMFQSGYRSAVLCLTGYGSPVSQGTKSSESPWCVLRGCNFRELPSRHTSYHEWTGFWYACC